MSKRTKKFKSEKVYFFDSAYESIRIGWTQEIKDSQFCRASETTGLVKIDGLFFSEDFVLPFKEPFISLPILRKRIKEYYLKLAENVAEECSKEKEYLLKLAEELAEECSKEKEYLEMAEMAKDMEVEEEET